jgi:hypothetical protein
VPLAFVRAPRLTLRFDAAPYDVIVHDRHQFVRRFFDGTQAHPHPAPRPARTTPPCCCRSRAGRTTTAPGPDPARRDIGWCREGHAIVVREGSSCARYATSHCAGRRRPSRDVHAARRAGRTASSWSSVALTFDVPPDGGVAVNGPVPPAETSVVHISSSSPRYGLGFLRLDSEPGLLRSLTAGADGYHRRTDLGNHRRRRRPA